MCTVVEVEPYFANANKNTRKCLLCKCLRLLPSVNAKMFLLAHLPLPAFNAELLATNNCTLCSLLTLSSQIEFGQKCSKIYLRKIVCYSMRMVFHIGSAQIKKVWVMCLLNHFFHIAFHKIIIIMVMNF